MWNLFFAIFGVLAMKQATIKKHPVYVSVLEIHYKPERQTLEIALKIFSDDLSDALSKYKKERVEIGTDREHAKADQWIQEYILQCLTIHIDGKKAEPTYLGKQLERSDFFAMWTFWEIKNITKINKVNIINKILFDYFSNQNNIITVWQGSSPKKRASLTKHNSEATFTF